ncbi:MAG: hypothetical protein AAFY42_11240, partial [Pseudomonadota bacterium]
HSRLRKAGMESRKPREPSGMAERTNAWSRSLLRRMEMIVPHWESIICGEGVAIPIRVNFDNLEEHKRPASEDPSFSELWNRQGGEEEIVDRVVLRWRSQG